MISSSWVARITGMSHQPQQVGYFWGRVSLYVQVNLDRKSPIFVSLCMWDDRDMPLHLSSLWDGVSQTFCLGWPQTAIHLISASQVTTILGLSHHTQQCFFVCMWYWGLNSGPHTCWVGTLHLSHSTSPNIPFYLFVCVWCEGFWTEGLKLARQALYHLSHSSSPVFLKMKYWGACGVS
jgi:hypothetical protein